MTEVNNTIILLILNFDYKYVISLRNREID